MLKSLKKAFLEASKSSNPDVINEGLRPQNPTLMQMKPEVQQDCPSMPGQEGNMSRPTPVKPEPVMPQQTCRKDRFVNAKLDQHLCHSCGSVAERYMLNMDRRIRWSWYCLKCRPYTEPERKQNLSAL